MRLEITMSYAQRNFEIPVNYNYLFYKALSAIIRSGNYYWNETMYDDICCHRLDEKSKLYTFSKFLNSRVSVSGSLLSGSGDCKLFFSAPINDLSKMNKLVQSLDIMNTINLEYDDKSVEFDIKEVKLLAEPSFGNIEKFIMLSPTTISKTRYTNNERFIQYLKATDEDTPGAKAYNLRKKYELVHRKKYNGPLEIKFDRNYIEYKGGAEGVSKLITIFENTNQETKIKAFIVPLKIIGRSDIISVAYQCGIGERNTLGMGMIERYERNSSFNTILRPNKTSEAS